MRTYTIAEAMALPYGFGADAFDYADYYGVMMEEAYIQANIVFTYSSYYVAECMLKATWGAVGFMVLLGMLRMVLHKFFLPRYPTFLYRTETFLNKHLLLASTVGKHGMERVRLLPGHGELQKWTTIHIPVRAHTLAIGAWSLVNFVLLFTPYWHVKPNVFWQDIGVPLSAYFRYVSDRTAILSFGYTPLTIALAMRNSPISLVTGASYSTLQIYHRWVARWTFIHAFVHGMMWTILEYMQGPGYFTQAFEEPYWSWGWAALAGGIVLVVFSHQRIRMLAYECFLVLHILGAVAWVVGCYYHVWYLEDADWLQWIYAAIAVWGFDRVVRAARIAWLNFPRILGRSRRTGRVFEAQAKLVNAGEFMRLQVTPARGWPNAAGGPGSFVFISMPWAWRAWGNHPLTIAWPADMPPVSDDADSAAAEGIDADLSHPTNKRSFELIIKRWDGFTKTLVRSIIANGKVDPERLGQEHLTVPIRLMVEGPYGSSVSFNHFDGALIVSGGSGISASIARLADIARDAAAGHLTLKKLILVWSVRDYHSIGVLTPYLVPLAGFFKDQPHGFLDVHIHVTGSGIASYSSKKEKSSSMESSVDEFSQDKGHKGPLYRNDSDSKDGGSSSDERSDEKEGAEGPVVVSEIKDMLHAPVGVPYTTHDGRPDVAVYLDELRRRQPVGKLGVASCGPPGLCDDVRVAVRERLSKNPEQALVFEEEAFTW